MSVSSFVNIEAAFAHHVKVCSDKRTDYIVYIFR
jgi:hypothetical protein